MVIYRSKKRNHRNESLDIQFTAVLQIYPGRECLILMVMMIIIWNGWAKNWRLSDKSSLLSVAAEGLKFGLTFLAYLAFVGRMWNGSWCTTKEKDYMCLNILFQCSTRGPGYIQVKGVSNVSTVGQMDRTWESIHLTLIMTWNIFSSL